MVLPPLTGENLRLKPLTWGPTVGMWWSGVQIRIFTSPNSGLFNTQAISCRISSQSFIYAFSLLPGSPANNATRFPALKLLAVWLSHPALTWNYHSIVKWLYSNIKVYFKKKKKLKSRIFGERVHLLAVDSCLIWRLQWCPEKRGCKEQAEKDGHLSGWACSMENSQFHSRMVFRIHLLLLPNRIFCQEWNCSVKHLY